MSELYLYMGKQQNVTFFLHTVFDKDKFKPEISHQIYNCMIHDKFFTSADQSVIIFDLNPFTNKNDVICIQHTNNNNILNFEKDNLQEQLQRLLKVDRYHEMLVISYNYDIGGYEFYTIDSKINGTNLTIPDIHLDSIDYILTTKAF